MDPKPCPFCQSDRLQARGGGDQWMLCLNCDAEGPKEATESLAIEAWNRRSPTPREQELREALERTERGLTLALGPIVEFGDLNGFRNMTDEELSSSMVSAMVSAAEHCSESLNIARAALTSGGAS